MGQHRAAAHEGTDLLLSRACTVMPLLNACHAFNLALLLICEGRTHVIGLIMSGLGSSGKLADETSPLFPTPDKMPRMLNSFILVQLSLALLWTSQRQIANKHQGVPLMNQMSRSRRMEVVYYHT